MEITAKLKNATFVNDGWEGRTPYIRGVISGDAKWRFHDGELIITSKIVAMYAGGIVKTRNSVYEVEFAPAPDDDPIAASPSTPLMPKASPALELVAA